MRQTGQIKFQTVCIGSMPKDTVFTIFSNGITHNQYYILKSGLAELYLNIKAKKSM